MQKNKIYTLHESRRKWNNLSKKKRGREEKKKEKWGGMAADRIHAIYHFLPQSLEFNFPAQ